MDNAVVSFTYTSYFFGLNLLQHTYAATPTTPIMTTIAAVNQAMLRESSKNDLDLSVEVVLAAVVVAGTMIVRGAETDRPSGSHAVTVKLMDCPVPSADKLVLTVTTPVLEISKYSLSTDDWSMTYVIVPI